MNYIKFLDKYGESLRFQLIEGRYISSIYHAMLIFRWFKFTLKPPYSGAHEHSLLAIWDTSHWSFFVKFGLRTA